MTDLSDIVNLFGTQNNLSGLQQWAQAGGASADPDYSHLAQLAPRTYSELFPQILARQQQMAALGMGSGATQQQPSQPSALAQIGSPGDSAVSYGSPDQTVPQTLPGATQPQAQQPMQQPPQSGLEQLQTAFKVGGGDVEKGLKIMQAQKALQVPPGTGPIPAGQQYVNGTLQNIPGAMTPGQQDRDKDFADIYTPFKNTGGQANAASQIQGIQGVIDDLNSGKLTTGDTAAKFSLDNEGMPTDIGKLADPSLIVASNQVAKAVLPSSKALFGARVTQGEVFRNLMANGLNPYASNDENVKNLTTLQNNLKSAQSNLAQAGAYFDKNGTLAGYKSPVAGIDPAATQLNPTGATNQPNPALLEALKKRGLLNGR